MPKVGLIFKCQTRGARDLDASGQYSTDLRLIFVFLFCSLAQSIAGHMCACVFIKLHITAQSGPVTLVIICHSHRVCVCVSIY